MSPAAPPTAAGVDVDDAWRWLVDRAHGAPGDAPDGEARPRALSDEAMALLDLYAPLCLGPARPRVLAHLAQSVDGRIATADGASQFLTGAEDLDHTHRLRALFDAVLVGAGTVFNDDPRLTTRRVPGPSPVRVILDPRGRLDLGRHRLFRDGAAPTLVVRRAPLPADMPPHVTRIAPPFAGDDGLDLPELLSLLEGHGIRRLFVEGGGVTVSRFLQARLCDRLQLTVAPVVLGSGRPALTLPPIAELDDALRPRCRRIPLGADILFDFDVLQKHRPTG